MKIWYRIKPKVLYIFSFEKGRGLHSLEVVFHYRDSKLQVGKTHSYSSNLKPNICKYCLADRVQTLIQFPIADREVQGASPQIARV